MAGRVQLETSGPQDIFFTDDPEYTYFVKNFQKHANFASFTRDLDVEGEIEFDNTLYIIRNRIEKEITRYDYNILNNAYYFLPKAKYNKIQLEESIILNKPIHGACWNIKSPCTHRPDIEVKKKFFVNFPTRKLTHELNSRR